MCSIKRHNTKSCSSSESESEEDAFHCSDFDDADYNPNHGSPELNEILLNNAPTKSFIKKANKRKKDLGKEYVTYKNKKVAAKDVKEIMECKQLCHTKISFDQQKKIFKAYWNLGDYAKRRQFLAGLIEVETKKSATLLKAKNPRNRQFNYLYHFEIYGRKERVCKKCFLKIFDETDQSVKTIIKYKFMEEAQGSIGIEKRGRHEPPHKLTIEKHNEVLEHINSIPKYQSHYSRRHTQKIYFQSNLNLATLYRLYSEKYSDPVSQSKYKEIFYQLDIKFKKPQLDCCNLCETLKAKIKNSTDEEEKKNLILEQTKHHAEADFAYECKKHDKQLPLTDKSKKMFSFDLQQCLPTPHLNASMFFYKRPLWTYNLTMHDGATNSANCYIWNETIAKRGANDIGSCIYKCLLELPETVKHVVLYSDSCPGQNRNSYITVMFEKILEEHPSIEVIDHKFLVVGHTHLECDTVHAQIEKKKKHCVGSIQHPHDWATLISATNKKYNVYELKQDDFFDFNSHLKKRYTWRTNNVSGIFNKYFFFCPSSYLFYSK